MSIISKDLLKKFECRFFKLSLVFLLFIFIFGYSPFSKKAFAINIYTIEDLDSIRNDLSGNHVLMGNLDFNDPASYSDSSPSNMDLYTKGDGWDPIESFLGRFDGGGYTISNLFMGTTSVSTNIGLFGRLLVGSTVINVGLLETKISVINADNVGSLVGENRGTVANSYSTGGVRGATCVGGLVGSNGLAREITYSYSSATVDGTDGTGGLVGCNSGDITNSYSTGNVTGNGDTGGLVGFSDSSGSIDKTYSTGQVLYFPSGSGGSAGGLVGLDEGTSAVSDSFWDTETSSMSTSDGGIGKTTLEMHAIATFTNWDIVDISVFDELNPNYWYIDEGNDYPRLFFQFAGYTPPPPEVDYTIDSIEDLNNIRYDLAGDYVLTKDLDFNSDASYSDPANKIAYTTGEGWDPIGIFGSGSWFSGTFDGNNFTISNLFIDTSSSSYSFGLFGYTYESSSIFDIGLLNASITAGSALEVGVLSGENEGTITNSYSTGLVVGRLWVGGLVSSNYGTISNSYSTGSVTGDYAVGGLAGHNVGGTINNSYSTADVTGYDTLGGLVGINRGSINNSYSRGFLSGHDSYGGLVGENDGTITNSYSTGVIESPENTGGLVGIDGDGEGTVTDSFWDTETSGIDVSDGGTGKTTVEMMSLLTFDISAPDENPSPWDIVKIENFNEEDPNIWYLDEGNDYPRLFWEFEGYTPPDDPDEDSPVLGAKTFHPDRRCHWKKPVHPTWVKLEPTEKNGVSGMLLTWTQYDADKINIKIDDGTGNYPWKIEKTSNDGNEFLPNVFSWQNIMIKPINHCKEGEYSIPVSRIAYPSGWYGQSENKVALASNALGYSKKSAVLGTATESVGTVSEEIPSENNPTVPETGSNDILYLTTSLSIIGFATYFVLNGKSRRFALRDFERKLSRGL